MEIKTYVENGMNVREIWVDGSLKGREITPIPSNIQAPEVSQPTNSEVAQMISSLQADLIIAGVI